LELKELYAQSYYHDKTGMLLLGDCLDWMSKIPDKSIDMILCDLPYGTTACKWDTIIPFEPLWNQYKRIIKTNSVIVLTASQPFTSALIMSNPKLFKYCWVWDKKNISNPFLARYQPLKQHEDICVFGGKNYYPIMEKREKPRKYKDKYGGGESFNKKGTGEKEYTLEEKYPKSILEFTNAEQKGKLHPTQKPVELFEYLLNTYSKENEIVLDNCAGASTTAIACKNLNRRWICIEKEQKYCEISKKRIESWVKTQ
jgi:site-specific DNA-methyltransferase (adenine-specific)